MRLGNESLEHLVVHRSWQDGLQERPSVAVAKRSDVKLRQPRQGRTDLARGEDDCDPLGHESSGHECECLRGRAIEPLGVIDEPEHRLLLGRLSQESEDRESDEIGVRRIAGAESEGDGKRLSLRVRQALHELEARRGELLKRRIGKVHLALDADCPGDAKRARHLDGVSQQGGLADAGLAVNDQHTAVPRARGLKQPVNGLALRAAPDKLLGRRCRGGIRPGRRSAHLCSTSVRQDVARVTTTDSEDAIVGGRHHDRRCPHPQR